MEINKAEKFILDLLQSKLPENLHYHKVSHTLDVVNSSTEIAIEENTANFARRDWRIIDRSIRPQLQINRRSNIGGKILDGGHIIIRVKDHPANKIFDIIAKEKIAPIGGGKLCRRIKRPSDDRGTAQRWIRIKRERNRAGR